jgi:hypothetical protein
MKLEKLLAPNLNIDEHIAKGFKELDFRAYANFFKRQSREAKTQGTKKDFALKGTQCAILSQICQNMQTIQ